MELAFRSARVPTCRFGVTARPAFSSNRCRWRGSADQSQSGSFDGKTVTGVGRTFVLGENTLFLDYRLERAQLAANPYAFNNLKDAKGPLRNGTADKPMMLLTAPGCSGSIIPMIPLAA